jgi:hypothetical protein
MTRSRNSIRGPLSVVCVQVWTATTTVTKNELRTKEQYTNGVATTNTSKQSIEEYHLLGYDAV